MAKNRRRRHQEPGRRAYPTVSLASLHSGSHRDNLFADLYNQSDAIADRRRFTLNNPTFDLNQSGYVRPYKHPDNNPEPYKGDNFKSKMTSTLAVEINRDAKTCTRRKERKEVLFSQGRGGSRVSRPNFTQKSKLRCK